MNFISGLQKTTLLDYDGILACTIFFNGCNFRCPFCHNYNLIDTTNHTPLYEESDIINFLKKRKNILEGVCISGGEPTLYSGLQDFIYKIKSLGFKVKLDTNGTNPKLLSSLISDKLIDYVAMDIKNCKEKYVISTGLSHFNLSLIEESINIIKDNMTSFEFRTTLVKQLHTASDLNQIGQWLKGNSIYYLQNFQPAPSVPNQQLTSFTDNELLQLLKEVLPFLPNAKIRGFH